MLALVPGRSTDESIVVEMRPKQLRLLRDECYRVCGVEVGTQTVTRLLTGATNVVPLVYGYAFEPAPRDCFGISCAPPGAPRMAARRTGDRAKQRLPGLKVLGECPDISR